jgi:pimeloyl-ACP methyl ester carboxylesterase
MAYTGHTDFTKSDPPTFAVVGDKDGIASASTMERRVNSMRSAGIDVEFHVYRNVGHGRIAVKSLVISHYPVNG